MKKLAPSVLLAVLLALFLLPMLALVLLAFLPSQAAQALIAQERVVLRSLRLSLQQFARTLSDKDYARQFGNSVILTCASLVLAMPIALGAGLFLSRLPRRWQHAFLVLYALSLLSPFQIIMLPIYKLSLLTGLYDSRWSVILLSAFAPIGPLTVCMLLRAIDSSQWEAALLETDSALQILRYVLLPQILPGLAALGLLIFAQVWNMVEQPLILLPDTRLRPLSTAFNDIVKSSSDHAFAGALLYTLPVLVFYLAAVLIVGKKAQKTKAAYLPLQKDK